MVSTRRNFDWERACSGATLLRGTRHSICMLKAVREDGLLCGPH